MNTNWKHILEAAVLIALYVLLGNARSVEQNPLIPGAVIAVNMFVPVLAGILFGARTGFLVGLLGTLINAFTPAGSVFELLSVAPHAVMGYAAGFASQRLPSPIATLSLVIGQSLNILLFSLFGLIPLGNLILPEFWVGIAYEILIGSVAAIILMTLYRMGVER